MVRVVGVVCGVGFSGFAHAACAWEGSASSFFRCMLDVSETVDSHEEVLTDLNTRVTAAEDATWSLSEVVLSAGEVLSTVAEEGYALLVDISPVGLTGLFSDLEDVPVGLMDGDDDTLGMLVCADGEVPVAFGSGWVCGAPGELSLGVIEDLIESEMSELLDRIEGLESSAPGSAGSGVMYGDYAIYNSVDLASLAGFTEVTGTLAIYPGPGMPAMDGLASLTRVGGNLEIAYAADLSDLDGLSNITSVGGMLTIAHNEALTDLEGLSGIEWVGGYVQIEDNDVLVSVSGLSNLITIGGLMDINENPALTDISLNVTSIGDRMELKSNGVMTSIDLSSLTSVGRSVEVVGNMSLTDLNLLGLTEVPGALQISTNDSLTTLAGLGNIVDIGEEFWVSTHANLETLDGLESVRTIGDQLRIIHNPVLTDVSGLLGVTSVGGTVFFYENWVLCQTLIDAFLDVLGITDHDTYSNGAC